MSTRRGERRHAASSPRHEHRFERYNAPSLRNWGEPPGEPGATALGRDAVVDCGWGRLVFAHTFRDPAHVAALLRAEEPGRRDIALYLRDPHVVLALAPQDLFLDPSHTYRRWLAERRPARGGPRAFGVRRLRRRADAVAINRLYALRHMMPVAPEFIWSARGARTLTHLVAEDRASGEVIGTATGVDHREAWEDPENGASLWCLAVDPSTAPPGVGLALVEHLAAHYHARGRAFLDLSVMHDNHEAIALYEKAGFRRVPVFCIKHKNPVNERLFIGPAPEEPALNPYAEIIVREARRRGIAVDVLDADAGYFALTHGGRRIVCRESLSEVTTAIAMSRCDDKRVTHRILAGAGLAVPEQQAAGAPEADAAFLARHRALVVKPARGEQGHGVSVDVRDPEALAAAIAAAGGPGAEVVLERFCAGEDLRVVVIDFEVVAAAVRRPPEVTGSGRHSVRELIEKQSRRRAAATGGESRIPIDEETERCVREAGHDLDAVPAPGERLRVRQAANLHAGGTIHDVTERLHPELARVARAAARVLDIPVVGFDLIVRAVDAPEYVFIEANERPGLANHEPQPTAERFVDLLFPLSATERHHEENRA